MVSSTLCPAVHILVSQNVYGRAEVIADHYWPRAVFFKILKFLYLILSRTADQDDVLQNRGWSFRPSVHGDRGFLRVDLRPEMGGWGPGARGLGLEKTI